VLEIAPSEAPNLASIKKLIGQIEVNVDSLGDLIPAERRRKILRDLKQIQIDPQTVASVLGGPTLTDEEFGTHFYIRPAS
ncbi:hypothetical protein NL487_29265, partial [Klebsiella pneumoniae]|nr:hypothetical protein [Klebsiella pneumoniae]